MIRKKYMRILTYIPLQCHRICTQMVYLLGKYMCGSPFLKYIASMKLTLTTLLVFGLYMITYGQPTPVDTDSLDQRIALARAVDDSAEVGRLLFEKGKVHYKTRDNAVAFEVFQESMSSFPQQLVPEYVPQLYFRAGLTVFFLKMIPLSKRPEMKGFSDTLDRRYLLQALETATAQKDTLLMAKSYDFLGKVAFMHERNHSDALRFSLRSISYFTALRDTSKLISLHQNTGTILYYLGKKDSSAYHSQLAYEYIKQRPTKSKKDSIGIGQISHNLASLYMELKDYEQAEIYLEKSLQVRRALADSVEIAVATHSFSKLYMNQEKWSEARKWAEESQKIYNHRDQGDFHSNILATLISLDIHDKAYPSALRRLSEEQELHLKNEEYNKLAATYGQKAVVFKLQAKLDSALRYIDKALVASKKEFFVQAYQNHLFQKSDIHKQRQEYDLALEAFEAASDIKDSLYIEKTQELLAEERVKQNIEDYQVAKENAELEAALLATQKERYIILAIALLCLLGIVSYAFYRIRNIQRQLQAQNLQLQRLDATKNKFFSMIAHDIRSPLSALTGIGEQLDYYLQKGDADRIRRFTQTVDRTTDRLSQLLDNLLNWALVQTETLPYAPEKVQVRTIVADCMDLYASASEVKGIELINEVPDETQVFADETALRTIIRNLIGNGLKFTHTGGHVRVEVRYDDDQLALIVEDNGVGMETHKQIQLFELKPKTDKGTAGEKGTGLGLILCNELAKLNQGMLQVTSELGKGSRFEVRLPVAG